MICKPSCLLTHDSIVIFLYLSSGLNVLQSSIVLTKTKLVVFFPLLERDITSFKVLNIAACLDIIDDKVLITSPLLTHITIDRLLILFKVLYVFHIRKFLDIGLKLLEQYQA